MCPTDDGLSLECFPLSATFYASIPYPFAAVPECSSASPMQHNYHPVHIYDQNNKLSDLLLMYIAQSSKLLKLMKIELNWVNRNEFRIRIKMAPKCMDTCYALSLCPQLFNGRRKSRDTLYYCSALPPLTESSSTIHDDTTSQDSFGNRDRHGPHPLSVGHSVWSVGRCCLTTWTRQTRS